MYGKSNMETYITICEIDSQWLLYASGNSEGLCINLEGWDGEEGRFRMEGTYIYLWLIHVEV